MQKVKAGLFAKKEIKTAYLLLAVPLGWWLVTGLFPILWGIGLSFCEWTGLGNSPIVNWGENFIIFFSSDIYVMSLVRSFLLGGGAFVLTTGSGFFIAFLLNKISKGKTLLRTIWYVPVVTSAVATTQIFNTLLDPFTGVINNIVKNLGGEPIVWMDSTFWAVFWILFYSVWKGIGGSILLWLAGLQSLDERLEEAAALDGANAFQIFVKIKIPQLANIGVFIFVNGMTGAMQIYEQVYFISDGGPYGTTEVLAYKILQEGFWNNNYGMACACAVVMMIVTFIMSYPGFKRMKEGYKV